MEYAKAINDSSCEIMFKGKFTFSDHQQFKPIFALLEQSGIKTLYLNFKDVEFVDSAALGILLLIRDESVRFSKQVVLQQPVGQVKKMFEISRFYDLFTISE